MAFNLEQWKQSTKQKLQGWKGRMERAGLRSAYFLIAASAFLPLVEAVHKGELTAMAVLGSAVGSNLLANMVQGLKDKTDIEVAHELEIHSVDPALMREIDAMLEKLDAIQEAEKSLSETDKEWFVNSIQQEMQKINSGIKYEAVNIDSSAIAQGSGAKAVGAGGIMIDGNAIGNILMGNLKSINDEKKKEKWQRPMR